MELYINIFQAPRRHVHHQGKDSQCSAPSLTSEAIRASATGKIQHFPWIRKSIGQDIALNNSVLSIHASTSVLPILATNHFGCDYVKAKSRHAGGETGEAQFSLASKDLITTNFWGSNIRIFAMLQSKS